MSTRGNSRCKSRPTTVYLCATRSPLRTHRLYVSATWLTKALLAMDLRPILLFPTRSPSSWRHHVRHMGLLPCLPHHILRRLRKHRLQHEQGAHICHRLRLLVPATFQHNWCDALLASSAQFLRASSATSVHRTYGCREGDTLRLRVRWLRWLSTSQPAGGQTASYLESVAWRYPERTRRTSGWPGLHTGAQIRGPSWSPDLVSHVRVSR